MANFISVLVVLVVLPLVIVVVVVVASMGVLVRAYMEVPVSVERQAEKGVIQKRKKGEKK